MLLRDSDGSSATKAITGSQLPHTTHSEGLTWRDGPGLGAPRRLRVGHLIVRGTVALSCSSHPRRSRLRRQAGPSDWGPVGTATPVPTAVSVPFLNMVHNIVIVDCHCHCYL